jgi:two-component system chemotaxis response regulator CheY
MADKVLIVDDSVSMRQMIHIILKGAGYEVDEAGSGPEALDKLSADHAAMITDYNMPEMNGVELIEKVRAGTVNKAIPILMLTTESEEAKRQAGKRAGATAWLTKPFQKGELVDVVRKVASTVEF